MAARDRDAMVTLSLLRHAKSKWGAGDMADFDRPLAPRGVKAAPAIGQYMREEGIAPNLVLCSPARRARQTLDLVLPFIEPRPEVRVDDDLYPASPDDMLECLRQAGDGHDHVMVVGHNPGMHALGRDLAGSGQPELVSEMAAKFPTGALAVLTFEAEWSSLAPATGHLKVFMVPKRLPGAGDA